MSDEKRMLGSYAVEQSIHIGSKEVVLGVDQKEKSPFIVCYCTYDNPFGAAWPTEAIGTDDYLEAMQEFCSRVQTQIEQTRAEQEKFNFDMAPFTIEDCIPDKKDQSIIGKVVVLNAEPKRYEYQHSAYQLILAEGGNGASGGRGQAVFATCLATGEMADGSGMMCLARSAQSVCPNGQRKPLPAYRRRKRQRNTVNGRNADGNTAIDPTGTEIHLRPEYAA